MELHEFNDLLRKRTEGSCAREYIQNLEDILSRFHQNHSASYSFCDQGCSLPVKEKFMENLLLCLDARSEAFVPDLGFQELALSSARILSREKMGLGYLHTEGYFKVLLSYADAPDGYDAENRSRVIVAEEAVKVLINAVHQNKESCGLFVDCGGVEIMQRGVCDPRAPFAYADFGLRLLFMVAAQCPAAVQRLRRAEALSELVGLCVRLTPSAGEPIERFDHHRQVLLSEIHKLLFAVTSRFSRFASSSVELTDADIALFGRLAESVRALLMHVVDACKDMQCPAIVQGMTLLFNSPPGVEANFVRNKDDKRVLDGLVQYIDQTARQADSEQLRGQLTAILCVARSYARSTPYIRRYLYCKILQSKRDMTKRPEQEATVRGHLVRLMTSHIVPLNLMVAEFLLVLCKENLARLTRHTGYGNAAGLLANRGVYGLPHELSNGPDFSSDSGLSEDSDLDMDNVDPVTGSIRPATTPPTAHLTEEEQDAEAEKLMDMFDRLAATGIQALGINENTGAVRELGKRTHTGP